MSLLPAVLFAALLLNERRRCRRAIAGMTNMRTLVVSAHRPDTEQRAQTVVIDLSTGQRLVADTKLMSENYAVGGTR